MISPTSIDDSAGVQKETYDARRVHAQFPLVPGSYYLDAQDAGPIQRVNSRANSLSFENGSYIHKNGSYV